MSILPIKDIEFQDNSIIKVVGVGGGGCNAVNYMFHQDIKDVTFLVCNTDRQALLKMDVPSKLQLGDQGLGAGGIPEVARELAEQSIDHIKEALQDGTKMVFVTAGMGGGTGTGAAPVIAKVAKEMGILTVGIVTIPFAFEGVFQIKKAIAGLSRLAQATDAILVINNEKLKKIYPDFDLPNAFNKSDEVVSNAAKAISEIITRTGYINTDFADVQNVLKDGNMAIMNVGIAEGENRITKAIENALNSPLVNTNDIKGASRILINFYCSEEHAIRMREFDQVDQFRADVGSDVMVKWGATYDDTLGESVRVTLIATGYPFSDIPDVEDVRKEEEKDKDKQTEEANKKQPIKTPETIGGAIEKLYRSDDDSNIPMEIVNSGEQPTLPNDKSAEQAEGEQATAEDEQATADGEQADAEQTTAEGEQADAEQATAEGEQAEAERTTVEGEQAEAEQTTAEGEQTEAEQADDVQTATDSKTTMVTTTPVQPADDSEFVSLSDRLREVQADTDFVYLDDITDEQFDAIENIPAWQRKKQN